MSYKGSSTDLDSGHEGLLSGTEDNDGIIVKSMEEELGYDKQDMQDISYSIDESADDAREDYISNQFGSPESGGMTDNAYGSDDPQMSPQMQKYALGLLKDYMAPAPDTPPQQVRGMGIVKGSGTPFPSLLQKKPERKYYTNKGLV